jgi:Sigma-70, region 4
VKDLRSILRLTGELGLSVREVADRLKLSKTSVSTYLLRAREAGLLGWPLPRAYDDDAALERLMFHRVGRPPQDLGEPDWAMIARELKRKGVYCPARRRSPASRTRSARPMAKRPRKS